MHGGSKVNVCVCVCVCWGGGFIDFLNHLSLGEGAGAELHCRALYSQVELPSGSQQTFFSSPHAAQTLRNAPRA